jgi:glycerol-3-phosphate dehydrogenase
MLFLSGQRWPNYFRHPYETDFTLIGTTDAEHSDPDVKPVWTAAEQRLSD